MHERVYRAMDSIVASHDADAELLIVAHGGSGKAVLGYANKMSIEELFGIPAIGNATMTILTRERESWSVAEPVLSDEVLCRGGL
jgi:broad specificity phosphatase PhoE